MPKEGTEIPPLQKIDPHEAKMIQVMFNYYDYEASGRVKRHLAWKLLTQLGLHILEDTLPAAVTLKDLMLFADVCAPEQNLEGSLQTSFRLAANKVESEELKVRPQGLVDFLKDLDRNPPTINESKTLLSSMLEYDDCSDSPAVTNEAFVTNIMNVAKKLSTSV